MDALLTSTLTVALAEIGDKTQLLSLVLATRFRNKWGIIAGILLATLLNHAASAWLGTWLAQFFESSTGQWLVGMSFIALAIWLLVPDKPDPINSRLDRYGAFIVATCLFFLAEIGDKTQIATVLLAAQYQEVLLVTLGTTVGMLLANVPVVYAGSRIAQSELMHNRWIRWAHIAAALLFIVVGVVHILG